jgi:hypothetical protein
MPSQTKMNMADPYPNHDIRWQTLANYSQPCKLDDVLDG